MTFLNGYETLEEIATGGFSTVYKVRELAPPYRCFAAKQFKNLYDHGVFELELHSLNAVRHLNAVQRLHRAIRHADQLVIMTEYVEGESLKSLVSRDGPLSEQRALATFLELCQIVATVHAEGMLHLDLKPSNILMTEQGSLVLTDFGIASPSHITRSEVAKTDFSYTSPEKYAGEQSPASDVYSLGVTLHYLLIGELPFQLHATSNAYKMLQHCTQPYEPPTALSESVRELLSRLLAKSPEQRPSLTQLIGLLKPLLNTPLNSDGQPAPNTPVLKTPSERECYAQGAQQQIPFAQYHFAILCEDDAKDEAKQLYRSAAEQGFARAQNNFALMLMKGGEPEPAERWYLKGAENGNAYCQYNLARYYGEQNDQEKEMYWMEKAANAGHDRAQNLVAIAKEDKGLLAEAFSLYQRAAYAGFKAAQYNMGLMYENNKHPDKSQDAIALARFWYEKAVEQNHEKAKQRLAKL